AQEMADGVNQIGPVQRIEVKLGDAAVDQTHDLFGGNSGSNQITGLLILFQAFKSVTEPIGNACSRFLRKTGHLFETMDGNDAWHDGDGDAAIAHAVEIAEEHLVVEEELGDGADGAGVDLRP